VAERAGYAAGTDVPAVRSRAEIERDLEAAGATAFRYAWESGRGLARIDFVAEERQVRFTVRLPDPAERRFTHTGRGQKRSGAQATAAYDAEVRRLWRAVLLVIKAKLEAVRSGILTMEEEFLAHVVLPDDTTVGQWAAGQLREVYGGGAMPALLPGPGDRR
jgi:hypothetical protein